MLDNYDKKKLLKKDVSAKDAESYVACESAYLRCMSSIGETADTGMIGVVAGNSGIAINDQVNLDMSYLWHWLSSSNNLDFE